MPSESENLGSVAVLFEKPRTKSERKKSQKSESNDQSPPELAAEIELESFSMKSGERWERTEP